MAIEVTIPNLGESISEVTLIEWLKAPGDYVERDEPICVLETDKANVELPSPAAGIIQPLRKSEETLSIGDVIAQLNEGTPTQPAAEVNTSASNTTLAQDPGPAKEAEPSTTTSSEISSTPTADLSEPQLSPAVRRLLDEHNVDPAAIKGSGKDGRPTKGDVIEFVEAQRTAAAQFPSISTPSKLSADQPEPPTSNTGGHGLRRVAMTRIRQRIAERLVTAQQTAAMLSTFNEVDLSAIIELRRRHKERFAEVHAVTLGFMSFFCRATVLALREFADLNASIDGTDIVYHDFVHLGIAVSTERGLLVPVLRHADTLSMAEIETEIKRLATGARDNKLTLDDLSGGTFTITNGGVFGSLLSTPILNPPQSGILGMHTIKDRPIAVDGEVVVRPMMYVALSYDHRLIDGQTSVTFLLRLKELLEDPARLMLEI